MKKHAPRFAAHNLPRALWVLTATLLAAYAAHGFQVGDLNYTTPDANNCVSVAGSAFTQPVNVTIPSNVTYTWTEWQEDKNGVRLLVTNSVVCNVTDVSDFAFRNKNSLLSVARSRSACIRSRARRTSRTIGRQPTPPAASSA